MSSILLALKNKMPVFSPSATELLFMKNISWQYALSIWS